MHNHVRTRTHTHNQLLMLCTSTIFSHVESLDFVFCAKKENNCVFNFSLDHTLSQSDASTILDCREGLEMDSNQKRLERERAAPFWMCWRTPIAQNTSGTRKPAQKWGSWTSWTEIHQSRALENTWTHNKWKYRYFPGHERRLVVACPQCCRGDFYIEAAGLKKN